MALQLAYPTAMGFTAPAAYLRITKFEGEKDSVKVYVEIHYDNGARMNNQRALGGVTVELALTDGATLAQMYAALKLDPRFASAIDV